MNTLDLILLAILAFFFLRGVFRGFVKETAGVAGLVAGFLLANTYYPAAADSLKPFVQSISYRHALGFELVFLVSFFLVSLVGILLDTLIKINISNVTNGLLGAVIGVGRGLVLLAVVVMAVPAFLRSETTIFKESQSWPYIRALSESFKEFVPADLKKSFEARPEILPEGLKPKLPDLPADGGGQPGPWKPVPGSSQPAKPAWPGQDKPQ
ncbi:MAG: CvpA family protein [Thermodesulfobacteriota bacterium]